jgi:glycine cleavage system transcriptional repressor
MLVGGNWNHLAKLESSLSTLDQNYNIGLHMHRIDGQLEYRDTIPYIIETFALNNRNILTNLVSFLQTHDITILEISSSHYPAHHVDSALFSSKLLIAIPKEQALISFREEFLDYCDQLNIDAILEPLKSKIL